MDVQLRLPAVPHCAALWPVLRELRRACDGVVLVKNFKRIAEGLDVSPLREALLARPWLFDDVPSNLRNLYPGSAHQDTRSILLRWCFPFNEKTAFNDLRAVDYPAANELAEAVSPLVVKLLEAAGGQLARVMINSLRSDGCIKPHSDEGAYAQASRRFHIVVQSSEGNVFRVGDETVQMKPGEAWWFDHRQEHEVRNESAEDRVHLIVDVEAV